MIWWWISGQIGMEMDYDNRMSALGARRFATFSNMNRALINSAWNTMVFMTWRDVRYLARQVSFKDTRSSSRHFFWHFPNSLILESGRLLRQCLPWQDATWICDHRLWRIIHMAETDTPSLPTLPSPRGIFGRIYAPVSLKWSRFEGNHKQLPCIDRMFEIITNVEVIESKNSRSSESSQIMALYDHELSQPPRNIIFQSYMYLIQGQLEQKKVYDQYKGAEIFCADARSLKRPQWQLTAVNR